MHAQAQGVAIMIGFVAADPDRALAGSAREQDHITAVRVLDVAAFDCSWYSEPPSNVDEFDRHLTAVPRIHAFSP